MRSTKIIEELFKNEFSGNKWRAYALKDALSLLETKASQNPDTSTRLLVRSARKAKDMTELLTIITSALLGEESD